MRRLVRMPSPAVIIAFIALVLAGVGTATALPGSNTVQKDDIGPGAEVGRSEIFTGGVAKSEIRRDSVGRSEAREDGDPGGGFRGAQINEGTLGPVRWAGGLTHKAFVNAAGGLVRGDGVVATSILVPPSSYVVVFNKDVTSCHWLATLGSTAGGEISAYAQAGNANAVGVTTRNSAGGLSPRPFHLAVLC
jgi:hypothetical protein